MPTLLTFFRILVTYYYSIGIGRYNSTFKSLLLSLNMISDTRTNVISDVILTTLNYFSSPEKCVQKKCHYPNYSFLFGNWTDASEKLPRSLDWLWLTWNLKWKLPSGVLVRWCHGFRIPVKFCKQTFGNKFLLILLVTISELNYSLWKHTTFLLNDSMVKVHSTTNRINQFEIWITGQISLINLRFRYGDLD